MPTYAQNPGDILWLNVLASGSFQLGETGALNAALTLSAANANAVVQMFTVDQVATAPTAQGVVASVQMPAGPLPLYFVQLASAGGTVNPLAPALVAAYALSAANGNAPVNVCRLYITVTAP